MNAEFDGTLSTTKKLVDFDEVGVKVLLLYVPVPKFGKVLFDVAADISVAGLPKLKIGAVLTVEDIFSRDPVLVIEDTIDTIFVGSVVSIVLAGKLVSFVSRIFVADTFNCAGDVFDKTVLDCVSIFALGLDEE